MKKTSAKDSTLNKLKGASHLATGAVLGVTDLTENLHRNIKKLAPVIGAEPSGGAGGISGFVYSSVRGVTRVVRASLDLAIDGFEKFLPQQLERSAGVSTTYEAAVAALNGVVGDHLAASQNPLAINMSFRKNGTVFDPSAAQVNGKVVVLVHGLCMNDLQWAPDVSLVHESFGARLSRELRYTPVYLHYNTGRNIAQNGQEFATQLEQLLANWPCAIEELVIIGHSMGGLVTRGACAIAQDQSMRWLKKLKAIVFLGSPHFGAPLEKAGGWVDAVLGMSPYTMPFTKLSLVRSAGIQDLRSGHLQSSPDSLFVQLPAGVRCYAVAATHSDSGSIKNLAGDGLVSVNSALGKHKDPNLRLNFAPSNTSIHYGINHFDLITDASVFADIKKWLS